MERSERAESDVQRQVGDRCALRAALVEHFGGEMQPGGRGGNRATIAREDRLVTGPVLRRVGPADVRRKRHMSDRLEGLVEVGCAGESHGPLAMGAALDYLRLQAFIEGEHLTDRYALAGPDERFPGQLVAGDRTEEEDFDERGARTPPGVEPRGDHPRVIENEAIRAAEGSAETRGSAGPPTRRMRDPKRASSRRSVRREAAAR